MWKTIEKIHGELAASVFNENLYGNRFIEPPFAFPTKKLSNHKLLLRKQSEQKGV